jgi:hypothetical protein
LVLVIPESNVRGEVKDSHGKGLSGQLGISQMAGEHYLKVAVVQGAFEIYLPKGHYLTNYGSNFKENTPNFYIYHPFTVMDEGQSTTITYTIHLDAPSVQGNVQYEDGTVPADGYVELGGEFGIGEISGAWGMTVNIVDGQFFAYLGDGTFEVVQFVSSEGTVRFDRDIVVKNGQLTEPLVLELGRSNVKGSVAFEAPTDRVIREVTIEDSNMKTYLVTVKDGQFSVLLPDGE